MLSGRPSQARIETELAVIGQGPGIGNPQTQSAAVAAIQKVLRPFNATRPSIGEANVGENAAAQCFAAGLEHIKGFASCQVVNSK